MNFKIIILIEKLKNEIWKNTEYIYNTYMKHRSNYNMQKLFIQSHDSNI